MNKNLINEKSVSLSQFWKLGDEYVGLDSYIEDILPDILRNYKKFRQ